MLTKDEYFYDCIGEFLETSFHCILYVRGVYPTCLFSKSIKYDIPVPISRSELLSRYISNSIDSLKPHFLKDTIEKVSLTILNKNDTPIEKFIFEISSSNDQLVQDTDNHEDNDIDTTNYYFNLQQKRLKTSSTTTTTTTTTNTSTTSSTNNNIPNLSQLEASFKSYILKILMTTDSFYNPLFYKLTQQSISQDTTSNNNGFDKLNSSDGVIHFNANDDENYKIINNNKKDDNNNNKKDNSDGDGDKDLKFTIHVYTKLPTISLNNNNNNNNNVNLNPNLSNILLNNINPLERPKQVNQITNQITPVWISTTKKESEIENSFIIPLISNISNGKNTTIKTFTEQSIFK